MSNVGHQGRYQGYGYIPSAIYYNVAKLQHSLVRYLEQILQIQKVFGLE